VWDVQKKGPPVCTRKTASNGAKMHPHRAAVESFKLAGSLPEPEEFTGVGDKNATVTVSFVAVAVCMPSMYSWVGSAAGAEEVFRDQLKAYKEILAGKTVSNKSVPVTQRSPLYYRVVPAPDTGASP